MEPVRRYFSRHAEPHLPGTPSDAGPWHFALVIPAYREAPALLDRLASLDNSRPVLVILVLNRPDSDSDTAANEPLREAIASLPAGSRMQSNLRRVKSGIDVYCHDLEALRGASASAQGVGLARKAGCDIAAYWHSEGTIESDWLLSSDADAAWPADYFLRLDSVSSKAVAAVYPFCHSGPAEPAVEAATALYELRLHHHVLGLEHAGSSYAFHTLGSCLAVRARAYVRVQGFPRRAGAEDFYLLNKLAKTGPVEQLAGACIALQNRRSHRAPFGTGPAVEKLLALEEMQNHRIFYHPGCYQALSAVLRAPEALHADGAATLPMAQDLSGDLAAAATAVLSDMKFPAALDHCYRHSGDAAQFRRQFNQWFDGFRQLRFIHNLERRGWRRCSLGELAELQPGFWPDNARKSNVAALLHAIRARLQWTPSDWADW